MKRLQKIILPILMISIVLSGCGKKDNVPTTVIEEEATAVEITTAKKETIKKELTYAGQVKPNKTVQVTSKLSGQVNKVFFDLGDSVTAGDTLFTLDEKDLRDKIRNLEAQLKISNASVASAQTGLSQVNGGQTESQKLQLQTSIENAKIQLDNAKIQLDNSEIGVNNAKDSLADIEKKYNDTKQLYEAGVATKSDFDSVELGYTQAQNGYNQAKNAYDQATNSYSQAQTGYNQSQENYNIFINQTTSDSEAKAKDGVNSAVASKESTATQLQIAKEALADTAVRSPITGIISSKNINESNMVSAQSAPFTIVDMSIVTVDVNVSERLINLINIGESVNVLIPTISDKYIPGIIKNISPAADNTSTFPVKIEINNASGAIKPGMFGEIHFVESQSTDTIVVPRNTVIEEESGNFIYLVKDNTALKTKIETGIDNGDTIEIKSGVNFGDDIVVKGQDYIDDKSKVKIVNSDGASNTELPSENETSATEQTTAKGE